jgi:hypothetical protein
MEQPDPTLNTQRPTSRDYRGWLDKLIDDSDEFAYRYVYDAYLVARDRDRGMYFSAEVLPTAGGAATLIRRHLLQEGDEDLLLASEEERLSFIAYLDARFGRGRGMTQWHDRAHQGFIEDPW